MRVCCRPATRTGDIRSLVPYVCRTAFISSCQRCRVYYSVFNLALRAACKLSGKLCCDPLAQFRCLFPLVRRSREELGTLFLNHSKTKKKLIIIMHFLFLNNNNNKNPIYKAPKALASEAL